MNQVTDPQITTVETIITNDDLESDAVGEVIEAETYAEEYEVSLKYFLFPPIRAGWSNRNVRVISARAYATSLLRVRDVFTL